MRIFRLYVKRLVKLLLFFTFALFIVACITFFSFHRVNPSGNAEHSRGDVMSVGLDPLEKIDWHDEELIRKDKERKGLYLHIEIFDKCTFL